jgi:hypothetical protein
VALKQTGAHRRNLQRWACRSHAVITQRHNPVMRHAGLTLAVGAGYGPR